MGLIDRLGEAADAVGDAARRAADAASEAAEAAAEAVGSAAQAAAETVEQAARGAVATAEELAEAAETQYQRFVHDPGALARQVQAGGLTAGSGVVQSARAFLSDVGTRAIHAGTQLIHTGAQLRDQVSETVSEGLRAAGREAVELGERAAGLERDVARQAREIGEGLIAAGRRGVELVDRGLEQAAESGRELLARGREAAEGVVAAGRELVDRVADTFDPGTHIRQLDSEGDSVKIKLGGFAQVEVRGEAAAELEVRRTAEGYEVEVSGEAGVGLIGQLGGEAGAEAQASARAMLMAGGKVTMSFRTAEEAERAVGALARMGAVAAASQAAPGPLGWVAGAGAQALIGPSEEDMQFLSQHTRSVELRGGAAGVVAGELGIAETLDVGGEAGLRQDMGLVIHFPERNAAGQVTRGPQVTVFHETTFAAKGEAAAVGAVRGAMEGKVRLEQTVQLPASVNMERFLQDPGAVAREVRDRATVQPARMKVEGWVRGGGGVSGLYAHAGAQAGAGFEYTIEGVNPQRALLATNYITAGDMQRGLEVIDPDATYSGQIYGYGYAGVEFAPEVSVLGVGVGIEAAYQHQDRGTPIRFQGRARELRFEDLQRRLEQAAQQPPPAVRQHR